MPGIEDCSKITAVIVSAAPSSYLWKAQPNKTANMTVPGIPARVNREQALALKCTSKLCELLQSQ